MARLSVDVLSSLILTSRDLVPVSTETTRQPRSSEETPPDPEAAQEADATTAPALDQETESTSTLRPTDRARTTASLATQTTVAQQTTTEKMRAREADPLPNPAHPNHLAALSPQEALQEIATEVERSISTLRTKVMTKPSCEFSLAGAIRLSMRICKECLFLR